MQLSIQPVNYEAMHISTMKNKTVNLQNRIHTCHNHSSRPILHFRLSYAPFHQLSSLYCHLAISEISEKDRHCNKDRAKERNEGETV